MHLQDQPPPGCAWGGSYVALIGLDPKEKLEPNGSITRYSGMSLGLVDEFSVSFTSPPKKLATLQPSVASVTRDELLSPDGFLLTFRVDGPNIQVSLNDRVIMSATDSSPDAYHSGRIALFASRIIATFEKLEIVPLDSE